MRIPGSAVRNTALARLRPGPAPAAAAAAGLALALAAPGPARAGAAGTVPVSTLAEAPAVLEDVRADLLELVQSGELPSFAVAAVRDGEPLWMETFGWADEEAGRPADATTSYRVASMGKSITATGLLVLAREGRVDLAEPVESYFAPGVGLTAHEGRTSGVTLRDVLQMTAAVPHGELDFRSREDYDAYSTGVMIRQRGSIIFPPGRVYLYSNFTYGILEHVIEQVSGDSFAGFLRRRVFDPLGMEDAAVYPDGVPAATRLATLYAAPGEPAERLFAIPQSSLGIYTSLTDLVQYARFHLQQPLPGGRAVLDATWLDRMHSDRPDLDDGKSPLTLGWGSLDLDGMPWLLSNGRAEGAQSTLSLLPEQGLAVICLTNVTGNTTDDVAFRICDVLAPGFMDRLQD